METILDVEVVDIIVNNQDDGSHPFHFHGYNFWVMGEGAGLWQGASSMATLNNTAPML